MTTYLTALPNATLTEVDCWLLLARSRDARVVVDEHTVDAPMAVHLGTGSIRLGPLPSTVVDTLVAAGRILLETGGRQGHLGWSVIATGPAQRLLGSETMRGTPDPHGSPRGAFVVVRGATVDGITFSRTA